MEDYGKEILGRDEQYLRIKRKAYSIIEKDAKWGNLNHDYIYKKEQDK